MGAANLMMGADIDYTDRRIRYETDSGVRRAESKRALLAAIEATGKVW